MDRQHIFDAILQIIQARMIDTAKLAMDDSPFKAHGIDSLTLIRLVSAIEERFGIEIPEHEAIAATSFARLVGVVHSKLHPGPKE